MDESPLLTALRTRIDAIDARLIGILRERMEVITQVGKLKKEKGTPFRDDQRWYAVLEKRMAEGEVAGLDPGFIRDLYELIHAAALTIEERA